MTEQRVRALRGATTAPVDEAPAIVEATAALLAEMLERNEVAPTDLVSLIFTTTADLTAEFPAAAARRLGISSIPLLCASEIAVPGSVPRCIRVLMHLYTDKNPDSLRHVYLEGAAHLRGDLEGKPKVED
jgi:chorismate mutase